MVQRDQRNHFTPPVLTGLAPLGSQRVRCHLGDRFTRETAMGHCRYCGHGAGWFRSSHRQCAATHRQGLAQMVDLVVATSGRPDFTQRRMLRILDGLVINDNRS